MKQATIYKISVIVLFFVAMMTLGGLGNAAVKEHFYWIAFAANIVVYGIVIWNLFRGIREEESKEE